MEEIWGNAFVDRANLRFDPVSDTVCVVEGVINLHADLELHVAEYVVLEPEPRSVKYRYHLQETGGRMVCRWDNSPHHKVVESFPHHLHAASGEVQPSSVRSLWDVFAQLTRYIDRQT
jgi:hypothetical protein